MLVTDPWRGGLGISPDVAKKMTIRQAMFFLTSAENIQKDVSSEEVNSIKEWHRRRKEAMAKEREAILAARAQSSQNEKGNA